MTPSSTPSGPARRTNVIALIVLVIAVLAVVLWKQTSGDDDPKRSAASSQQPSEGSGRTSQITAALGSLSRAWAAHDEEAFVKAAGTSSGAKAWARQTYANLEVVGAGSFEARFIAEDSGTIRSDGTFSGDVEVSWTPSKVSGLAPVATVPATVAMYFRPTADGYGIEETSPKKGPEPLWLAGTLSAQHAGNRRIIYLDRPDLPSSLSGTRLARMDKRAVAAVRRVVGHKAGPSELVVPSRAAQAAALLGQQPDTLSQIAAVTTTVDGSTSPRAPVYAVLNPGVFAGLDRRAAQVVLSHEFTHLLTDVAASKMELWVAEGFADYVALHEDKLGVKKSASQILALVRKKGPPKHLPDATDFGSAQHGLGATYEGAWLIFEVLHQRVDDQAIVAFYDAVRDGTPVRKALRKHTGLTVKELTRDWRRYLKRLA